MKIILSTGLVSLISGFAFVGGCCLAAFIYEAAQPKSSGRTEPDWETVQLPPDLCVVNQRRLVNTPYLTVEGEIENVGSESWTDVLVQVVVKAGNAQVAICKSEEPLGVRAMSKT